MATFFSTSYRRDKPCANLIVADHGWSGRKVCIAWSRALFTKGGLDGLFLRFHESTFVLVPHIIGAPCQLRHDKQVVTQTIISKVNSVGIL